MTDKELARQFLIETGIYTKAVELNNRESLTAEEYRKRVHAGIEQCMRGECISLEDLSKELGYNYR